MDSTQITNNNYESLENKFMNCKKRFDLAMRNSSDGLWDWNLETNEVYYSARWKEMLGYKESELGNTINTWESLVCGQTDSILQKANEYIYGKRDEFKVEIRMLHKEGYEVVFLSKALLVEKDDLGKPIRLIGTHVDITEQKRFEKLLKKTNQILEMISIGKLASEIYDEIALMYEDRHPGLRCSLLELEDGKLLHGAAPSMPKEYCDAVHGLKSGPDVGSCGKSTYTGKRVIVEDIYTDSKWKELKQFALPHGMRCCWSEPIINSNGKVLGAFGMYYDYPSLPNDEELKDLVSAARLASIVMERDQSKKRESKDQKLIFEQAKLASMGEMIGNISHQWRQPLSVISSVASGIQLSELYEMNDSTSITENMDKILEQTKYLSSTIDDFKSFLKEAKSKQSFFITDVLNSSLKIIDSSYKNNYITIVKNYEDDISIEGFKNEFSQAIINIFNNAKDAILQNNSSEDRYVWINTKKADNSLMIEIQDNGMGIDENIINRVFEPYFTTKHQSIGTGIGLSMSHKIITERHNGYIKASNEEIIYKDKKYKGACFRIYIYNNKV